MHKAPAHFVNRLPSIKTLILSFFAILISITEFIYCLLTYISYRLHIQVNNSGLEPTVLSLVAKSAVACQLGNNGCGYLTGAGHISPLDGTDPISVHVQSHQCSMLPEARVSSWEPVTMSRWSVGFYCRGTVAWRMSPKFASRVW